MGLCTVTQSLFIAAERLCNLAKPVCKSAEEFCRFTKPLCKLRSSDANLQPLTIGEGQSFAI